MSILEIDGIFAEHTGSEASAPYRAGDRIRAISPEGMEFLARVESVQRTAAGDFTVVASVTEPRRFRSHLLTTVVGPDGYGSAVRPSGRGLRLV